MPDYAPQRHTVSVNETVIVSCDFTGKLSDDGTPELLTGTPTVSEVETAELQISEEAINVDPVTIDGTEVPPGRAVQFKLTPPAATKGNEYELLLVCSTTGGQVRDGGIFIKVN